MILPLAFILAGAAPTDALAGRLADYSGCLRVNAGRPERQAAPERARFAIAQCHSEREAAISLGAEQLATQFTATIARARIEKALADLDAVFPAILAAGAGVEIPLPIAPQVRRYTDCLVEQINARGGMQAGDRQAYTAVVEASITACVTVRTATLGEAETLLSVRPEFVDANRRQEAISRAFDETDEVQRNLFQIMDAVSHEQGIHAQN